MIKKFLRFGETSPIKIAKILLITLLVSVLLKALFTYFPTMFSPFEHYYVLEITKLVQLIINVIEIRIGCELTYYVFMAFRKYLNEN